MYVGMHTLLCFWVVGPVWAWGEPPGPHVVQRPFGKGNRNNYHAILSATGQRLA